MPACKYSRVVSVARWVLIRCAVPLQRLQVLAARNEYVTHPALRLRSIITDYVAEVVLAVLLSHFTFELTEKRIWWNMATVQYPSADPRGEHPELPLKVGLVRREVVQA